MIPSIRCHRHGTNCKRAPGRRGRDTSLCADGIRMIIDLLVAGSACTDFSSYGSNQNQAGPTIPFLLLLMRLVLEYEPEVFVFENVVPFPMALLEDALHCKYVLEEVFLFPDFSGCGFPIARQRKYIICRLSSHAKLLAGNKKHYIYMHI